MSRTQGLLATIVLIASLTACEQLGDRARPISFVNHTGQTIFLYPDGRSHPANRSTVVADERLDTAWLDPHLPANDDKVKFRVEATTGGDALLYCHDFTWKELGALRWLVEVRLVNDCT